MVILNKIYTRAGDGGETALASGEKREKFDLRVSAYGTVDEANACIGVARLHVGEAEGEGELDASLERIQNDLFDLGADLATPCESESSEPSRSALRLAGKQVDWLESEIDRINENLSPLRSFVLPGGSSASAHLHLARAVARRAERLAVELSRREEVSKPCLLYLNRLSDFLFVAARAANGWGERDRLWRPGEGAS